MAGPIRPPLRVIESDDSVDVFPTNKISFNAGDFAISKSGTTATISIDATGTGAILSEGLIGFGSASDLLTGSANFTFTDETGGSGPTILLTGDKPILKIQDDTAATDYYTEIQKSGHSFIFIQKDSAGGDKEFLRFGSSQFIVNNNQENVDAKIATTGEAAMFYVDAGNDNIGIGAVPPATTERLHITGTGTDDTVVIASTAAGSSSDAPNLVLYRNTVGVDDTFLGALNYRGQTLDGTAVEYAEIRAYITDPSNSSEDCLFQFRTAKAGVMVEQLRMRESGVVFNEDGNSALDFRVESDSNNSIFKVDSSQDNVGIGASPDSGVERLHISGTGVGTDIVRIETINDGAASGPHVQFYRNSATPQDGDDLGELFFAGDHAASSGAASAGKVNYARMRVESPDVVTGVECGRILFDVATNGSLIEFARMTSSGSSGYIVFNEASNNIDFRVESNGNANMFKVDAGIDRVSVGDTPTSGGATFQVPNSTISSYCNINAVRSDSVATQLFTNEDCQGQLWVNNSATAWTLKLPEGGVKGMWFSFVSTNGDMDVDPLGSDTLNGGTATLSRDTDNEVYQVLCIDSGVWILSNPN